MLFFFKPRIKKGTLIPSEILPISPDFNGEISINTDLIAGSASVLAVNKTNNIPAFNKKNFVIKNKQRIYVGRIKNT